MSTKIPPVTAPQLGLEFAAPWELATPPTSHSEVRIDSLVALRTLAETDAQALVGTDLAQVLALTARLRDPDGHVAPRMTMVMYLTLVLRGGSRGEALITAAGPAGTVQRWSWLAVAAAAVHTAVTAGQNVGAWRVEVLRENPRRTRFGAASPRRP